MTIDEARELKKELLREPFQREERYIVIKRKHLSDYVEKEVRGLMNYYQIPSIDCVVVESDWPEYETVWNMIEERCS